MMLWQVILHYIQRIPAHLARLNWVLLLCQYSILCLSVILIHGVGQACGGGLERYWLRQIFWIGIGTGAMVFVMAIHYRHWGELAWVVYLLTLLPLVLVLLFGKTINGAKSWLMLAPGIYLQPAEFAKIGIAIALSWFASLEWVDMRRWRWLLLSAAIVIIPMFLILLQPDLGSALVFIPISATVIFLAGIRIRFVLITLISVLVAIPILYRFAFKYHQRQRVLIFVKPFVSDETFQALYYWGHKKQTGHRRIILDDWNVRQSELAISSGGRFGKGIGRGTQHTLGYLPRKVAPTDFIFSVLGEELGFFGTSGVLLLYSVMLLTILHISARAADKFGKYLAASLAAMFFMHIFINAGMTVRLAPVIGIPLPFMSYGGSGMLSMMVATGFLQSIYIHRNEKEKQH